MKLREVVNYVILRVRKWREEYSESASLSEVLRTGFMENCVFIRPGDGLG